MSEFFSWSEAEIWEAHSKCAAQQEVRCAKLADHAKLYGQLYADNEALTDERGQQTLLVEVRMEAAALGPTATRGKSDAAAQQEADRLDEEAPDLRTLAAKHRTKAKTAAKAQELETDMAEKAEATKLESQAAALEERALAIRSGGLGATAKDRFDDQRRRESLELTPQLHQKCGEEVLQLRQEWDARVKRDDYEAAAKLNKKEVAYEVLPGQDAGRAGRDEVALRAA